MNCDTDNDGKCNLNCDTNGDGKCDLNCDTNKDGKCDLNCDTDNDGKCNLNCDTNGDGKCDLNCDTNGDGKCDTNCDTNGDGKCDKNCDNTDINEGDEFVLTLTGSDYDISKVTPGWTGNKTFKLTNTTDKPQTISMKWIDVTNTFTTTNNIYYTITNNSKTVLKDARAPYKESDILTNITIPAKKTYEWSFKFEFRDTGKNQDIDMGKVFDAKIKIIVK